MVENKRYLTSSTWKFKFKTEGEKVVWWHSYNFFSEADPNNHQKCIYDIRASDQAVTNDDKTSSDVFQNEALDNDSANTNHSDEKCDAEESIPEFIKLVFPTLKIRKFAVWKLQNFSITWILREIGKCRDSTFTIFKQHI